LFSVHRKHAQDKRIRSLLEVEAFLEIHRQWQRLGYPFDALVPSYATALGASADRPAALAELMGIIVNDGVRKPSVLVESLRFAQGSPYETVLRRRTDDAQRVLPVEVAHAVRGLLRDVVDNGTAKRAKDVFNAPMAARFHLAARPAPGTIVSMWSAGTANCWHRAW
jgi:membrane peptidoglycan carboxypeptidase